MLTVVVGLLESATSKTFRPFHNWYSLMPSTLRTRRAPGGMKGGAVTGAGASASAVAGVATAAEAGVSAAHAGEHSNAAKTSAANEGRIGFMAGGTWVLD
ncbi:hypothetical protein GCM10011396_47430 [Undibacterium terreum]|uniref:Uncharacterized protein n=1 Tax=Undibacterium terreum TaxID=1224302 RepID=A0A916UYW2_9BURK|nr:hypothetical protein GCM10011396_47430 [Undibacterium terreum]